MPRNAGGVRLRGRRREQEVLDHLLRTVRDGRSQVLVLRGEPGVGKTALLDHLAARAGGCVVTRTAGVEPESEIAYSALQQVCAPLLDHLDRLPEPQHAALSTAFGLTVGDPPDGLLVGLAVLGLFAEAATARPLVCVVDDAQWLDRMSEVILTFVARRLDAESVALVLASRGPGDDLLRGLPELRVEGLPDADARALLDSVLTGPVDARVRDRIVAETRGNPLALLELPRGLTPAELAFGLGGPSPAALVTRVEEGFQRRIAALPDQTRRLLLTAAVEPIGDVPLLWRALERLGIGPEAGAPAADAGLVEIGTRVRFRHPLVRSAAWRSAEPTALRLVHRALADATDPARDPDRRAWHRAHAALGPDDEVAGELERCADRARARGGNAAAASFLERATELTADPRRRATLALAAAHAWFAAGAPAAVPDLLSAADLGPLDGRERADAQRLRARVTFALNPGREAGPALLAAAHRLETLDPAAARATYLSALGAAVHAGRLGDGDLHRAARAAREVTPGTDAGGLLLAGLTAWSLDGYAPALPLLNDALDALARQDDPGLLWLAAPVAHEVWREADWFRLTERALAHARGPAALTFRAGALLYGGRLADAADLLDEAGALERATGLAAHPSAALALAAHRGHEAAALELIDSTVKDADARGEGRLLGLAGYARAVLFNGLSDYPAALAAAREGAGYEDLAVYHWTLGELVEAATRAGAPAVAAEARERLAERTAAAGTNWALGAQALADALAGRPARAEECFREAVDRLSATRMGLPLARARLLCGEWLRRQNRLVDARTHLRLAYDAFTAMGADGFAERTGRELTAAGDPVRHRAAAGAAADLTAQETQIARLAGAGRTNPEIGAVLFLSPRTVEWHLRKIYMKLGITSRRELRGR
ncbi:ATP-binding protein [Asanoa siamensis]|uniref:Helix-turn-helix transcriptional regulator n=1 Tax=Asanoa siamensis TaxID=926357 RepID=A0ABQ4D185_9ACTN|nr:LuxR family transcriptional regulator [Asanoa siamensis]GIF76867.1 helix-turn-helix transcriptional regulator [Asanoa siamensis]